MCDPILSIHKSGGQILVKNSQYKVSRKSVQWKPDGRTDGHDEANSPFRNIV